MIVTQSTVAVLAAVAMIAAVRPDDPESPPPVPERRATTAADRLLASAKEAFRAAADDLKTDPRAIDRAYRASRLWLDAQRALATDDEAREVAFAEHRDRMRLVARAYHAGQRAEDASASTEADVGAMLAEAEFRAAGAGDLSRADESGGSGDSDTKTAETLKRLDEPLAMNFPNETPLEDVLKYVKQATRNPGGDGVSIYVDPIGLNESGNTLASPVAIDIDGVPLKRTLRMMLRQLGLVCFVEDGVLVITSAASGDLSPGEAVAAPSPIDREVAKAARGEMTAAAMKDLAERLKLIEEIRRLRRALKSAPGESSSDLGSRPLM